MPSTTSLAKQLARDYPQFQITPGETFQWVPETHTIAYLPDGLPADLLHELAHGLLGHRDFTRDITLLEMERDAWHHATTTLAPNYGMAIDDSTVQDALDTYREWLHSRSICPECGATGIQSSNHQYRCLACLTNWRVNDARHCALRRYKTT
jgi:hypothetical protein